MAEGISFDPYLGWVDVVDPNNVPPDVRTIGAADLLRYEKLGRDTVTKFTEVEQALADLDSDAAIATSLAQPDSQTRTAIQGLVDEGVAGFQTVIDTVPANVQLQVPPLVTQALAADGTVANAAATAVNSKLAEAGVVTGATENTGVNPDANDIKGGWVGENGRLTDLVVDSAGKVPDLVMGEWATRIGTTLKVPPTIEPSGADETVGGFTGENGRETDLVVRADGTVPDRTLTAWAPRLGPIISPYITQIGPAVPKVDPMLIGSRKIRIRDAQGVVRLQTSRSDQFAAWGDSLTDGWTKPPFAADQSDSWPGVLATLLGKPVYNGGKSGQSADEIALRQGGMVMLVVPAGGVIPASGAVTVTTSSAIGWRVDRSWSDVGTIAGVPGTLSRSGSVLTFTRTTAGTEVAVPVEVPFVSTLGTTHAESTSYFMIGRNDIGYTNPTPGVGNDVRNRLNAANIAAVGGLTPKNPRFFIFGTLNSTGEGVGSTNYNIITGSNDDLARLYPDNYYDMRKYIVEQSIYDQGITPTAADLTSIANGRPPATIMLDSIHYTVATARTIAQKAYDLTVAKGWNL
jgi:hypothetical protein